MFAEIATDPVPEPSDLIVLVSPSGGSHWHQLVVARPSGLTVPLSVAVVDVTAVAASVATTGADLVVAAGAVVAAVLRNIARGIAAPNTVILFHLIRLPFLARNEA